MYRNVCLEVFLQSLPVIQMIVEADFTTKFILIVLLLMSLGSWGIILIKLFAYQKSQGANARFFKKFMQIKNFIALPSLCSQSKESALKQLTQDVLEETGKFSEFVSYDSIQHRASLVEDTIQRSIEALRLQEDSHLSFLAISSNLAPFFGLLGTVWGIMVAFFEIGQHGSADLSMMAPGIAAALITTVAGLLVAIPASAAYNIFVAKNAQNEIAYYNFGSHVLSLFKRGDLIALEEIA